ncbi:response regulator transcription factor [Actinomyces sp. MRS3W]|uniref:response regulator transcription factor n=1 Tax=Actinomyces sp. MRS3W TaxID=2800796 RepID=UPI0028FDAEEB|nr:response regulator transcription factor [Actinomyces sp. MRS3W]MDU0349562.1 response regulator transcription factor [Actinomyces sp. MRS3W]
MRDVISVLIAEDQGLLRASLRALIDAEPGLTVVGAVADGDEAVALTRRERPDVVVMDIRMPGLDGIEATARICADPDLADTRVLVLTMFELDDYVLGALRAGASGFLLKDADPQVLVDAVRTIHSGQSLLGASVMTRLLAHSVPGGGTPGHLEGLTPRQRQVLMLIARGLSNSEIEEELGITRATCRSHITALLARLGARDRAQLVIAAYESGLVAPTASHDH